MCDHGVMSLRLKLGFRVGTVGRGARPRLPAWRCIQSSRHFFLRPRRPADCLARRCGGGGLRRGTRSRFHSSAVACLRSSPERPPSTRISNSWEPLFLAGPSTQGGGGRVGNTELHDCFYCAERMATALSRSSTSSSLVLARRRSTPTRSAIFSSRRSSGYRSTICSASPSFST